MLRNVCTIYSNLKNREKYHKNKPLKLSERKTIYFNSIAIYKIEFEVIKIKPLKITLSYQSIMQLNK